MNCPSCHSRHSGPRGIAAVDLAIVADVAGLELVHAQPCVQVQRGTQLVLVVLDGAAGFMVADQVHTLFRPYADSASMSKSGVARVKSKS